MKVDFKDLPVRKNPVLSYCRKLIDEGTESSTVLEVYRGEVLCLTMIVGEAAKYSVVEPESRTGKGVRYPYLEKYNDFWDRGSRIESISTPLTTV